VRRSSPEAARLRTGSTSYDRVTIVAHSLGSVIVRRALLDLAQDKTLRKKLGAIQVVLFAPAHLGARIVSLATEALGVFQLPIGPLVKFRWPVLTDLEQPSQTLALLLEQTESEFAVCTTANEPTSHIIAGGVMHAEHDKIVSQNAFFRDPPMTPAPNRGHSDCCKPTAAYRDPVDFLLQFV
jgi:hypothetical protein